MKSLICVFMFVFMFLSPFSATANWKSSESTHFRLFYREKMVDPKPILQIAENFYTEMSRISLKISDETITIWICETQKDFQAYVHAPIQDWAVGCAFPLSRRIIVQNPSQITAAKLQLAQVLRHEIAHVLFGQYTRKSVKGIPLWFVEGIAIYFSKEWVPGRHKTLLSNVFSKSIIPLQELSQKFPVSQKGADLAYAQSQDAVRWFVEINGIETLWAVIDHLHKGTTLNKAFAAVVGYDLETFDQLWRESLPQRYHWASFLSSSYVFWGGISGLFLICYLITRNRRRKQLDRLIQQETRIDPFFKE